MHPSQNARTVGGGLADRRSAGDDAHKPKALDGMFGNGRDDASRRIAIASALIIALIGAAFVFGGGGDVGDD